jgi:hypothetical protein
MWTDDFEIFVSGTVMRGLNALDRTFVLTH